MVPITSTGSITTTKEATTGNSAAPAAVALKSLTKAGTENSKDGSSLAGGLAAVAGSNDAALAAAAANKQQWDDVLRQQALEQWEGLGKAAGERVGKAINMLTG